jgi:hypothetical protein
MHSRRLLDDSWEHVRADSDTIPDYGENRLRAEGEFPEALRASSSLRGARHAPMARALCPGAGKTHRVERMQNMAFGTGSLEFRWWPDEDRPGSTREFESREEALFWLTHAQSEEMVRGIRQMLANQALAQLSGMSDEDVLDETASLLFSHRLLVTGGDQARDRAAAEDPHKQFEDWTIAHLKQFFPVQSSAMAANQLRDLVQSGIRRAASYGVTKHRDVSKYIDLMIVFGRNFDTDFRHPWAGEILRRRGNSQVMMKTLLEKAKAALGAR